jgi:hypothetical protein
MGEHNGYIDACGGYNLRRGNDSDYCYGDCNEEKGTIKGKGIGYNKGGAF